MKRTLGITVLFLLAAAAWGQVSTPSVSYVSSAPSGACSPGAAGAGAQQQRRDLHVQ